MKRLASAIISGLALTIFVLYSLVPAYAASSLLTNITGYWKFDEPSGNAADATGNSLTLTNTNTVTYVAGKINNAGHFVGASSQKESRLDLSGTTAGGAITVAAWYKVNTAPSASSQIVIDVASSATSPYISYILSYVDTAGTKTISFNRQKQAVANQAITSTQNLGTGTYHYLVGTYDGANANLYLDGTLVAGPTAISGNGAGPNDANNETVVGALHSAQGSFATGDIDEPAVWSRALTAAEVTSLYNAGTGLQYPFGTAAIIGLYFFGLF